MRKPLACSGIPAQQVDPLCQRIEKGLLASFFSSGQGKECGQLDFLHQNGKFKSKSTSIKGAFLVISAG